jgi:hypothetical protein
MESNSVVELISLMRPVCVYVQNINLYLEYASEVR